MFSLAIGLWPAYKVFLDNTILRHMILKTIHNTENFYVFKFDKGKFKLSFPFT